MSDFNKYKGTVMSLYRKYLEEHHEADKSGQVCSVCNKCILDKCVECKGCHCKTHAVCYNLKRHPEKVWYCIVCEDILRYCMNVPDYDKFEEEQVDRVEPEIMANRNEIFCCICGYSEGAMIRTVLNGVYCHLSCVSWCEEVQLSNTKGAVDQSLFQKYYASPQNLIPICNPFYLNPKRMEGICSICHRQGGVVWCSYPECSHCCHVFCGYKGGWKFYSSSLPKWRDHEGCPPFLSTKREIFCSEHTPFALFRSSNPIEAYDNNHESSQPSSFGDKSDLDTSPSLSICDANIALVQSNPCDSLHYCDICQAKWRDLTCLSWSLSLFKIPRFFRNIPLANAIIEKGRKEKKKGIKKELLSCINYLSNFDKALDSGVWKIEKRNVIKNIILDPKSNSSSSSSSSSKKGTSIGSVKRSDVSLSSSPKKVKVESKEQTTQKGSNSTKPRKALSSQCNRCCILQEPNRCLRQHFHFCPQIETPDLSVTLKGSLQERALKARLTDLISSVKFFSLFGKYPYKDMLSSDQAFHKYIHFYHRGVNKQIYERYKKGNYNLNGILDASNEDLVLLEQMLVDLSDNCKSLNTMIFVLRCLFVSTFYSIYPPHLCSMRMAKEKSTYSRNLVVETNHLASICGILFDLVLEFNNLLSYYKDGKKYKQLRSSPDSRLQCICLCEPCDDSLRLVCDSCHVGYHAECLGLRQTGYPEILQTKFCGYWYLKQGFLCPRCCVGEIYEMNRFEKGSVQIKEKFLKSCKMSYSKKKGTKLTIV